MSWSDGYNDYLLQRGNGNFEDREDSQSSQERDSSLKVTEHLSLGHAYLIKLRNATKEKKYSICVVCTVCMVCAVCSLESAWSACWGDPTRSGDKSILPNESETLSWSPKKYRVGEGHHLLPRSFQEKFTFSFIKVVLGDASTHRDNEGSVTGVLLHPAARPPSRRG